MAPKTDVSQAIGLLTSQGIPIILLQHGVKDPVSRDGEQWILAAGDGLPPNAQNMNIGIMCGWQKGSPIISVGVDCYKPGWEKASEWVKKLDVSTKGNVWVIKTGRGGLAVCYYYNGPDLKRQASLMNGTLDLLTNGFQVIPPSNTYRLTNPKGGPYTWVKGHSPGDIPVSELAEPPEKLIKWWQMQRDTPDVKENSNHRENPIFIEVIPEGQRNNEITRRYGILVKKNRTDAYSLIQLVNQQCCKPPLGNKELQTIIGSIDRREGSRPVPVVSTPDKPDWERNLPW